MANFVVNSSQTVAIRKSDILAFATEAYEKGQPEGDPITGFQLVITTNRARDPDIIFERAATEELLAPFVLSFYNSMEEE